MTADKELLELAAKAAGNGLKWADPNRFVNGGMVLGITGCSNNCESKGQKCDCDIFAYWNPLTDDGDALRLAVKTHQLQNNRWMRHLNLDDYKKDPYAATRRAIVRAAAAIGAAIGAEK